MARSCQAFLGAHVLASGRSDSYAFVWLHTCAPQETVLNRDGKVMTLQEVFDSLNLKAHDLSVDTLDMHVRRRPRRWTGSPSRKMMRCALHPGRIHNVHAPALHAMRTNPRSSQRRGLWGDALLAAVVPRCCPECVAVP